MEHKHARLDNLVITEIIEPNTNILDLGCGNGELMSLLVGEKGCTAHGIEKDEQAIYECVEKGLNVLHGDIDSGLSEYSDESFDYVILNQSLQQVAHFDTVFREALRVGKKVIVGLPNFAHYKSRLQLFFLGRAPVTSSLPYSWYDSPNVHFLSMTDFIHYCSSRNAKIERSVFLGEKKRVALLPNLFANVGIFLLTK
ncbi:MAG: methionine biosynthesis protein MetW [Candidatus Omnitrophica bacterium]|nr:methionine biosynthesis protein MetW [Candidatus Omnitrophota bacterium]MDD5236312.1 methionine biosynthesis protein MetW [Candidatus Omnitrophota bacterium]MDD5610315.1 methionine biosynthesis protein MetW [Candidatus Omnitrophota bacterium]